MFLFLCFTQLTFKLWKKQYKWSYRILICIWDTKLTVWGKIPIWKFIRKKCFILRWSPAYNGKKRNRNCSLQLLTFSGTRNYGIKEMYKFKQIERINNSKFSKLDSLLILNPFLRSSFNEGNVISQTFNYLSTGTSLKNSNNFVKIIKRNLN